MSGLGEDWDLPAVEELFYYSQPNYPGLRYPDNAGLQRHQNTAIIADIVGPINVVAAMTMAIHQRRHDSRRHPAHEVVRNRTAIRTAFILALEEEDVINMAANHRYLTWLVESGGWLEFLESHAGIDGVHRSSLRPEARDPTATLAILYSCWIRAYAFCDDTDYAWQIAATLDSGASRMLDWASEFMRQWINRNGPCELRLYSGILLYGALWGVLRNNEAPLLRGCDEVVSPGLAWALGITELLHGFRGAFIEARSKVAVSTDLSMGYFFSKVFLDILGRRK